MDLATFTTLVVIGLFLLALEFPNILKFIILECTYILIMHISIEFMRRHQRIKTANLELILALANALDSRDHYTYVHSFNVARYAIKIVKKMGLPKDMIEIIERGGLLHDIEKICIPESVLLKPGKLTDEEYQIIKGHPVIGYEMIKHVTDFKDKGILDCVLYHHERYDGKDYPKGLKGNEISLVARIIAISDTFDAMTSKRVYRHEINLESTLIEIEKNKGTQFDPEITDIFLSLFESEKEKLEFRNQMNRSKDGSRTYDPNSLLS